MIGICFCFKIRVLGIPDLSDSRLSLGLVAIFNTRRVLSMGMKKKVNFKYEYESVF